MTLKEFLVFLYCVFSYLCPFLQSYKSTSMIDIKFLVKNPDVVRENIKKKFQDSKLPLVDEAIPNIANANNAPTTCARNATPSPRRSVSSSKTRRSRKPMR